MDVLQKKKKKKKASQMNTGTQKALSVVRHLEKVSVPWAVCVITQLKAAVPLSEVLNLRLLPQVCWRKLQKSDKRVSTFCNRKCDHRLHPATDAKLRKNTLGWKCHANSWVQPLNTSGVLSTPVGAFKGQGFVQSRLCRFSPRQCEWPRCPAAADRREV